MMQFNFVSSNLSIPGLGTGINIKNSKIFFINLCLVQKRGRLVLIDCAIQLGHRPNLDKVNRFSNHHSASLLRPARPILTIEFSSVQIMKNVFEKPGNGIEAHILKEIYAILFAEEMLPKFIRLNDTFLIWVPRHSTIKRNEEPNTYTHQRSGVKVLGRQPTWTLITPPTNISC